MRIGISCVKCGLGRYGGVQVFLRDFLTALAKYDCTDNQYVLLTPRESELPFEAESPKFSVFRLDPPPEVSLPIRAMKRLLRRLGIRDFLPLYASEIMGEGISNLNLDLIHFPATTKDFPYPLPSESKIVLTFHDMAHEFYPQLFSQEELKRRHASYRSSVNRADSVIAISRFTARTLQERYNVGNNRLQVVYEGVSERFSPTADAEALAGVRVKCGLPQDYVFYPSNPWPHKNHLRLLQALNLLRQTHGVEYALVTTGKLSEVKANVQDLAAQAGYPSRLVHDLGFVSEADMEALYNLARLMVFPSLFEGFGIPILEAMASACPVVCSNATSLPELGGDAVRYVDPNSVASIAEGIFEVWNDCDLRATLVSRGLERVRRFSWREAVRQTLTVYQYTASGHQIHREVCKHACC